MNFQRSGGLRHGNDWQHLIFRGFNGFVNYFRPLVVALFTLEVRAFQVTPGPMHVISLMVHIVNTLLVGLLAMHLSAGESRSGQHWFVMTLAMLLYGLHPLLVEPVVWIDCQFDLIATLFMLLGLLLNASLKRNFPRMLAVALCFFLAACSKESAAPFPLFIVVFDWLKLPISKSTPKLAQLQSLISRNWPVYVLTLVAGITYLFLRHWALGSLALEAGTDQLPALPRAQQASFLYLRYWRMFFWPMTGMGPLHPIDSIQFFNFSSMSILRDVGAVSMVLIGFILTLRRSFTGGLILVVTFSLLPVLHVLAANVDASLYHERYAMTALAIACAMVPGCLQETPIPANIRDVCSIAALVALAAWIALSIMNIRQTIPLWSSQLKLWEWAYQENPTYVGAKDQLITAYIGAGKNEKATYIINDVIARSENCPMCMLNGASMALKEGKADLAEFYLSKIKNPNELRFNNATYDFYLIDQAEVLILRNRAAEAEPILRQAIAADGSDPEPQFTLAVALALQGKILAAKSAQKSAMSLYVPDGTERARREETFTALLDSLQTTSGKGADVTRN